MVTNCAPFAADFVLLCSVSDNNQANVMEAFKDICY